MCSSSIHAVSAVRHVACMVQLDLFVKVSVVMGLCMCSNAGTN